MKSFKQASFLILILTNASCNLITGRGNEFNYDYNRNEIVGSIRRLDIKVDSPLTYYTYELLKNRNGTDRLNIINPDTSMYEFTVSAYSKDTLAYQHQRFVLHPNTQYKITNYSNGDSKSYTIIIKTNSSGAFSK